MTRSCGECYRCCIALGITELKKYQDQSCRHLDGRNPTARCSIYDDRPACCRQYACLWREGHFDEDDRPDKSGVIANFSRLEVTGSWILARNDNHQKPAPGQIECGGEYRAV